MPKLKKIQITAAVHFIKMEGEFSGTMEEGKYYVQNGCSNKRGGWQTMPYIMGNETFEKLASLSLIANLVVYLRTQYNLDALSAATIYNVWHASCNFSPLLGAFISDAYIGKFRTLIYGSITSTLGMLLLALGAALPALRPQSCLTGMQCEHPTSWQLTLLFTALGFLVIGAGGIRPCNVAFGVDQFDVKTDKGEKYLASFYNWYYLSLTIALLLAVTVVVYIQNSVSWVWGLAICAGFMALSVLVFICGARLYVITNPRGSVFSSMARVVVASYRKRLLNAMEYKLYEAPVYFDSIRVAHTDRFKFFDKAAFITDGDVFVLDGDGYPTDEWRLCSVEQVEQLKSLISILPVWISGITCFVIKDQQNSFGVQQAMQLDTNVWKFRVPPGSLGLTSLITLAIYIPIYERVILPISCKLTKNGIQLTHRMIAGILMSMLCMLTSGFVEGKRRASAVENGSVIAPMSFTWLLPQFAFSGLTEAMMGIALMEFFNRQLPQSMRTVAGAFVFLNLAAANYLTTVIINIISNSSINWLGGSDLNKNKLDYFYYVIAGLALINFIYFITFARHYVVDNASVETDMEAVNIREYEEKERMQVLAMK